MRLRRVGIDTESRLLDVPESEMRFRINYRNEFLLIFPYHVDSSIR
jgi:hypothetical protein